jgi:hypothetical protein
MSALCITHYSTIEATKLQTVDTTIGATYFESFFYAHCSTFVFTFISAIFVSE